MKREQINKLKKSEEERKRKKEKLIAQNAKQKEAIAFAFF